MNIVFVAAESAPFVKVGGLADVVGSLPSTLIEMGHRVCVILPHHGPIDDAKHGIEHIETFEMPWSGGTADVRVAHVEQRGVPVYFLRAWPFFQPQEDFVYSHDEGIDVGRFLFFSMAALALTRRLAEEEGWQPDVFHVHDWHTAMVPFFLRRVFYSDPVLNHAGVLFTIHNMRYQGWGIGWHLEHNGLPHVDHPFLHVLDKSDNALAVGLAYSTMLNTVSPHYAQEIVEERGGFGLDSLLDARRLHLRGILNGIDDTRWNPARSVEGRSSFDVTSLQARALNRQALQERLGLPKRDDIPIAGTVLRLVDQKGPSILLPAMWHMLTHADMQFVLLGTGFHHYEEEARRLGEAFPNKAAVVLAFDESLAELIYAGSDMFLMPSMFEPCGIGQMIAMRYGAIPIVRAVGGLVDTVTPDSGFLFRDYHQGALQWAVGQALDEWHNDPEAWQQRQIRAMEKDLSWQRSASDYTELYRRTLQVHQSYT